jgi:hypothetical protein
MAVDRIYFMPNLFLVYSLALDSFDINHQMQKLNTTNKKLE